MLVCDILEVVKLSVYRCNCGQPENQIHLTVYVAHMWPCDLILAYTKSGPCGMHACVSLRDMHVCGGMFFVSSNYVYKFWYICVQIVPTIYCHGVLKILDECSSVYINSNTDYKLYLLSVFVCLYVGVIKEMIASSLLWFLLNFV